MKPKVVTSLTALLYILSTAVQIQSFFEEYIYIYIYIYIYCLKKRRLYTKFHAIWNHQVYYLYSALKITKTRVKNNTSKNASKNTLIFVLPYTFSAIDHLILDII